MADYIITCSMCDAPLAIIASWADSKNPDKKSSVTAKCCFCGDKSFEQIIEGKMGIMSTAYALVNPHVDDQLTYSDGLTTIILDTEKIQEWQK